MQVLVQARRQGLTRAAVLAIRAVLLPPRCLAPHRAKEDVAERVAAMSWSQEQKAEVHGTQLVPAMAGGKRVW